MKECMEMDDFLSAYIDGELADREKREVLGHVADCVDCRRKLSLLERMKGALGQLPVPPMPEELRRTLLSQLPAPPIAARREPFRIPWWRLGFASAMAMAAFLIIQRSGLAGSEDVPLDVLLAAHGQYSRTLPLAPAEIILSQMPEPLAAGPADSDDLL